MNTMRQGSERRRQRARPGTFKGIVKRSRFCCSDAAGLRQSDEQPAAQRSARRAAACTPLRGVRFPLWSRQRVIQIAFWITLRFDQKRPFCGQDGDFSKSLFGFLFVLTRNDPFVVKMATFPKHFLDFYSF
ncbi:MAG: hypothetical protein QM270_00345 [Bacillota bacterium]|nr:hypothetical protein [Bacillota bacterium]